MRTQPLRHNTHTHARTHIHTHTHMHTHICAHTKAQARSRSGFSIAPSRTTRSRRTTSSSPSWRPQLHQPPMPNRNQAKATTYAWAQQALGRVARRKRQHTLHDVLGVDPGAPEVVPCFKQATTPAHPPSRHAHTHSCAHVQEEAPANTPAEFTPPPNHPLHCIRGRLH